MDGLLGLAGIIIFLVMDRIIPSFPTWKCTSKIFPLSMSSIHNHISSSTRLHHCEKYDDIGWWCPSSHIVGLPPWRKKPQRNSNRTWRPRLHHTSGQAPHAVVQQRDQQVIKLLPRNTGWPVCLKEKSPGEKIHEHPWTFEMDDDWGYPYIKKSPTQCFFDFNGFK